MRPLFCLLFLSLTGALAAQRYPVRTGDHWGLIDRTGTLRVPATYLAIGALDTFGLVSVRDTSGLGLIDTLDRLVLPPVYAAIRVYHPAFIEVRRPGESSSIINSSNRPIYTTPVEEARLLTADLLAIRQKDKWGVLNARGERVIESRYSAIEPWAPPYLKIFRGNQVGISTHSGKEILAAEQDEVKREGGIFLFRKNENWGAVDSLGRSLWEARYRAVRRLSSSYWQLSGERETVLLNTDTGRRVRLTADVRLEALAPDRFTSHSSGRTGVIDGAGRLILPTTYRDVLPFAPGCYRVGTASGYGLYHETRGELLSPDQTFISTLRYGVALVRSANGAGLINAAGEWLLPPRYARIEVAANEARAFRAGAVTSVYYDAAGRLRERAAYGNFTRIRIGVSATSGEATDDEWSVGAFAWFRDAANGKWGLRDARTGEAVIPSTFDEIDVHRAAGFTLVGIDKATPHTYARTRFRFGRVYGLVRHSDGLLVTGMRLLHCHWEDWAAGNATMRCLLDNGRYALLDPTGQFVRTDYAYIGPFVDGFARASAAGQLSATLRAPESLGSLADYLTGLRAPVRMVDFTAYDQAFERAAQLYCADCSWGVLDDRGRRAVRARYDYATDPIDDILLVQRDGRWGAVGVDSQAILPLRFDAVDRLPGGLLRTYRADAAEGLVDTAGQLRLTLRYAEIGKRGETLVAVKQDGRWGFATPTGELRIPARYREVRAFRYGYAAVREDLHWGFIDPTGKTIIPCRYDAAGPAAGGYFPVERDGAAYYLTATGERHALPIFERVGPFHRGVAAVRAGGKWGLIDTTGHYLVRPRFAAIGEFDQHGLAQVHYGPQHKRRGLVDTRGQLLTPAGGYAHIGDFYGGLAAVESKGQWGYIDTTGAVVISPQYDAAGRFSEGYAAVKRGVYWAYLDRNGRPLTDFIFSRGLPFHDGRAVVYRHARETGLIDTTGGYVIAPELNRLLDFAGGRGRMRGPDARYYYIGETRRRHGDDYADAGRYQHGVAAVRSDDTYYGLIDREGATVLPAHYTRIGPFERGLARVRSAGRLGLYTTTGTCLLPEQYEYIGPAGGGILRVVSQGRIGYVDRAGKWIWAVR